MAETPFVPPTSTAYSSVFTLVRDWLGLAGLGADAPVLDSLARNIAADMCNRDLAPAAYGDKRQPYHSGACIGIDGMSVNLRFSDDSAEFVFGDEDLELINEEGRDLYIARLPASEVLALRQCLIDYLPASEAEISAGHGVAPPVSVTVPAAGSEERHFWLEAAEQHGFEATSGEELPAFDPPAYLATEDEVLKLMAAAREQGRKDMLDALALPSPTQAATDVLAERRRQVEAEGWTPGHDDEHRDGEIARAAAAYAYASQYDDYSRKVGTCPAWWPWDRLWWKPTNSRCDLVKAGALILAEIERLDRAALATGGARG